VSRISFGSDWKLSEGEATVRLSQRLGWIGVDVGTHTVKLAQVVRDGAAVRLHRAAVIQRPAAWIGDDSLGREQPITSQPEIQAALECGEFVGRNAVCSLPMNICQLRSLNIPPGTEQERRTIIADELAEDWADLQNPMEFDFWEMEAARGDKSSDGFNVSVIAASRLWIGQLWRDCRRAGMDCWAIDGLPLAMARAMDIAGRVSVGQRVLVVDWGFSNTTLCIVGDGRPLYSRRIQDCAFGRVLESISAAFEVTLDEARHLAESEGLGVSHGGAVSLSDVATAITDAAAPSLDELVRQMTRTLQFTDMQRRHLQPAAIWILGGGASLKNLDKHLTQALSLPVHIVSLAAAEGTIACAAGNRSAMFGSAAALSALAWRAA
jgi:type IV pilus assembly protein PilM